ncbi:serine hydrolase domain-containing protein [Agitococcus lubricus]|uniref:CubicO group peptidase (Beta-lactamase class C family) n=1 Tax=Agitococcus lubricus TaxID=1077255 RepID=A0A2T5J1C5_9GAMM|nr:serine hydrolase domain-containing protein [Agitococcus lubricus]PTQ90191.1 CubicO group peptidase (beta-lactamase class C family) [Agitococcus lubricus]
MLSDRINRILPYIKTGGRRLPVPKDLSRITTIDRERECDAQQLGLPADAIDKIWQSVEAYYKTGLHPAITLVIRYKGHIVMSRGLGYSHVGAEGESPDDGSKLATADTPICLFSGSKAISAMLIHKLAEEGKLKLHDRVCQYIPEYASHGKHLTTIHDLLTHKAGIRIMPVANPEPALMFDFDAVVKILAESPPVGTPKKHQAYHAVTAGYILGAIAQNASGETLPQLLNRILAKPLGCEHFTFGVDETRRHEIALSHATGVDKVPIASKMIEHMLGVNDREIIDAINSPEGLSAVVPAANIYCSAEEACRFYQMLLDGGLWQGQRVFEAATVANATRRGALRFDHSAKAPMRYSAGFMRGEKLWTIFGANTADAFGHLGFINILCWADTARDISVAFLNTGKSLAPEGFIGFANVTSTISSVFKAK